MTISIVGQNYSAGGTQSGNKLPSHETKEQSIQPLTQDPNNQSANDSSHVTLSRESANSEAKAGRLANKYAATVEAIDRGLDQKQSSSSPATNKTDIANPSTTLLELGPVKLFNAADVAAYQERLMSELLSRGVDTSIPIDLRVDSSGTVIVNGDHPDKESIEQAFKDDKDLRNGFVQTSNYFMFQEIFAQHEQWAQKIDSGVLEETANLWLIYAVKDTVAKSSNGITLENGQFQDPFSSDKHSLMAMKAYQ